MTSVDHVQLNELLIRRLLSTVKLFQGFTTADLTELLTHAHKYAAVSGQRLLTEGDAGDAFFVILSGGVSVSCRAGGVEEKQLAILEPGDSFGEIGLLEQGPRSASITAISDTLLLTFRADDVTRMAALAPKLYRNIACMLASRLRQTNATISLIMDEAAHPPSSIRLGASGQRRKH